MTDVASTNFHDPFLGIETLSTLGYHCSFPENQGLVYIPCKTPPWSAAPWKSNKESTWSNKRSSHSPNIYASKSIMWEFQTLGLTIESIGKEGTNSRIWPRKIRFVEPLLGCFCSWMYSPYVSVFNSKTATRWSKSLLFFLFLNHHRFILTPLLSFPFYNPTPSLTL